MNQEHPDAMPAHVSPESWKYLAKVVKERREFIGLSQEELAEYGGPAKTTVSKIERAGATAYSSKTQQQLEKALGWDRGAIRSLLAVAENYPNDMDSAQAEFVEAELPDLTGHATERVTTARDLSDDELLAELTYRMKRYGQLLEGKDGEGDAGDPAPTNAGESATPIETDGLKKSDVALAYRESATKGRKRQQKGDQENH